MIIQRIIRGYLQERRPTSSRAKWLCWKPKLSILIGPRGTVLLHHHRGRPVQTAPFLDQPDMILQNNLLALTNHRCLPQAHHTPHGVQENSEEKETMTPDLIPSYLHQSRLAVNYFLVISVKAIWAVGRRRQWKYMTRCLSITIADNRQQTVYWGSSTIHLHIYELLKPQMKT